MTRSLNLSLFIFVLLSVLTHNVVHSYCVLNEMEDDTQIKVLQTSGQSQAGQMIGRPFYHVMGPGSKECCNFSNGECNKTQDRNSSVKIDMTATKDDGKKNGSTLSLICPSDGYIVARGTFEKYIYQAYNANHEEVGSVSMN